MGYLDKAGLSRAFTKLKTLIDNKADVGHTHTKNQVGLGNVDNTADSTKSVKYAESSNYANLSGKANGIVVCDTRNENPAPSSTAFDKQQLTADFKMNDKINSPTGFSGTYCGVLSLAPWSETSGGHGYQLAFGYASAGHPRLALRGSDLSANAWNSWYKIYTSDDKPTLSELGAAAASHTHTKSQITDFAHTHDDRYYTESEINSKLSEKANSSHTHTKSQITDFPTSMPASDVYSWAKQSSKPSYSASEVGAVPTSRKVNGKALSSDISISAGDVGAAPSSHSHNYAGSSSAGGSANWANGADYANYAFSNNGVSTSGDGSAYEATISGFSLDTGKSIVIIPNVTSTTTTPTLNVSGTGAKNIRMRLSSSTSSTIPLINSNFLTQYKPVKVTYDGTYWVIDDFIQPDANNLYGTLISSGSSAPSSGTAGFIYIQTT